MVAVVAFVVVRVQLFIVTLYPDTLSSSLSLSLLFLLSLSLLLFLADMESEMSPLVLSSSTTGLLSSSSSSSSSSFANDLAVVCKETRDFHGHHSDHRDHRSVINWKSEAREKALGLIEHQWKKADRRKQRQEGQQDTPQRTETRTEVGTFFKKNIVVLFKH